MNQVIISVEGNIASGKSTFLNVIKEYNPEFNVVPEPLHEWQNVTTPNCGSSEAPRRVVESYNLFNLMSMDPQKYSFPFQMITLNSHIKMLSDAKRFGGVSILERSFHTNLNVFTKIAHDKGYINDVEWTVYNVYLRDYIIKPFGKESVSGVVYVDTKPEVCYERLKRRGRTEENGVDLNYLKLVDEYHKKWILSRNSKNILIIDNNLDKLSSQDYGEDMKKLKDFIEVCGL